ncbi:head-tail joining protein [Hyphobacterium sp.]|uniref:head-tail joining protein n=1 Tax=Hyphobacterium sp. TaxID=2004662 RepID=UPI003B52629D
MSQFSDAFGGALDTIYATMGDAAKYRTPGGAADGSEDLDCVVIVDRESERYDLGDMGPTRADGVSARIRKSDLAAPMRTGTIRPSAGEYSGRVLTVMADPDVIANDEWRLTVKLSA